MIANQYNSCARMQFMQQFTLGFIFDTSLKKILLVHKNKPAWQKGKINGIGGKLRKNESRKVGIRRETFEESGLIIPARSWTYVATIKDSPETTIYVLTAVYNNDLSDAKSKTGEKVQWFKTIKLPNTTISNLMWLIPLCLNRLNDKAPKEVQIRY